jgi:hypothetical protein
MDDDEWLAQRFREDGPSGPVTFRSAVSSDARALTELVDAAYRHYVDRIGMLPGPMTQDYADVIATRQTTVAEISGLPVGRGLSSDRTIRWTVVQHGTRRQQPGHERVNVRRASRRRRPGGQLARPPTETVIVRAPPAER